MLDSPNLRADTIWAPIHVVVITMTTHFQRKSTYPIVHVLLIFCNPWTVQVWMNNCTQMIPSCQQCCIPDFVVIVMQKCSSRSHPCLTPKELISSIWICKNRLATEIRRKEHGTNIHSMCCDSDTGLHARVVASRMICSTPERNTSSLHFDVSLSST